MTTPTPAPAGVPLWSEERIDKVIEHQEVVYHQSEPSTPFARLHSMSHMLEIMRNEYEAELTKLRAQLAEQWTPLPDGFYYNEADMSAVIIKGDTLRAGDSENRGETVVLSPHIRLCSKPKEQAQD